MNDWNLDSLTTRSYIKIARGMKQKFLAGSLLEHLEIVALEPFEIRIFEFLKYLRLDYVPVFVKNFAQKIKDNISNAMILTDAQKAEYKGIILKMIIEIVLPFDRLVLFVHLYLVQNLPDADEIELEQTARSLVEKSEIFENRLELDEKFIFDQDYLASGIEAGIRERHVRHASS